MTNSKSTKRALLTSAMSILLCVSMLLGTTFAWFTDSVVSANNVIKAGNLDVAVEYTLGDKDAAGEFIWEDLATAENDLFQKGLWEPGHTEVVALRIKNNGTLALKYNANMNIVSETKGKNSKDEDIVLSDILTVSTLTQQAVEADGSANMVGDIALMLAFTGEEGVAYESTSKFKDGNVLGSDKELQPGAAHYLFVKVDMAETVGNEANAKDKDSVPSITFGINVLATQFTYEDDSFGNDYDEDSEYFVEATNAAVVAAILTNGGTLSLTEPLTLNGGLAVNADATLANGTISNPTTSYAFSANKGTFTIENAEYEGSAGLRVQGGELVVNGGTYHISGNTSSSRHTFYVAEGRAIINGGTFTRSNNKTEGLKRGATIYAAAGTEVVINGGSFAKGHASTGNIIGDGTVTIYGGIFEFEPTNWLAEGYTATQGENGWWTVSKL